MSNFKEYPQEARDIRQLVENRRHYLNIIYAIAILVTFQLTTTFGWYSYFTEAYAHFMSGFEQLTYSLAMIIFTLEAVLLYMAIHSKRSALLVLLIIFFFLQCALKLALILMTYPIGSGFRYKFSDITRYSEYDAMSLTYDIVMVSCAVICCAMSCAATWHFTPLVIVKMNYKETQEEAVAQAMKKLKKTKLTTYDVRSSDEESAHRISRGLNGKQFISKNQHKKTFSTQITENADVTVTTSGVRSNKNEVRIN